MHAKYFLIHYCGNRQTVKAVGERLPELDIVAPLALVVETIDAVDRGALVVSSQNKEIFRVLYFVS